ncbi:hypothetical protein NEOLEDRAFT_377206 [Neolentinus lepideus HHB14362 ss-1]|uniref:Uncharacterized protein n=1 Tax=Neolentinus lepideus HHB14362 ss-1 TaxID=1314782 RepID=A0A165SJU1_9AGAM|nr:hypothetical protein NEOLEDRAFT_377206 [Neolentinus lepideus HHB14362 ss-1]
MQQNGVNLVSPLEMSSVIVEEFRPLYIGAIISNMLYGVGSAQVVYYYSTYQNDEILLKCLVAILWIIDTVQQFFLNQAFWHYLVNRCYYSLSCLLASNWSFTSQGTLGAIVALIVECFYIRRIWMLSKHKWALFTLLPALVAWDTSWTYSHPWLQRKGISTSRLLVDSLIKFVVATGLLPVILNIIGLVANLVPDNVLPSSAWVAVVFVYGKA